MAKNYPNGFKNFVNIALMYNENINLEDVTIMYFEKVNPKVTKDIKKITLALFDELHVDPNGKNGMIFTMACKYGHLDVIKYLVEEKHVDPNINSEMGFIFACRFGHYNVAKYLALKGANIKAKNCLSLKLLQKDKAFNNKDREWLLNCY